MCAFCRDSLSGEPCEALRCGHCFHTGCLQEYCDSTGRSKHEACPFKCNFTAADEAALAGVASSEETVPETAWHAAAVLPESLVVEGAVVDAVAAAVESFR